MRLIDADELMTVTDVREDGTEVTYVPYSEIEDAPTAYDPDKVAEQLKYNITLFIDKDGEKVLLDDAIEIVKAGGNADLLIDRAKSKSGERIPYDGKWK